MSLPPVRFHHLKAMARSARQARLKLEGSEQDETYAMERGTGCHALVFGTQRVTCYDGKVRRGKEYESFEADNQDAIILTAAEYDKAQRMAEAVLFDPAAAPLLQGCVYEGTLLFDLEGRPCRVTPDIRHPVTHVADLKTCKSAQPEEFLRDARYRFYDAQVAWQRLGTQMALGYRPSAGYIIAVESAPPWEVTVIEVTEARLDAGEERCREWLRRLLECEVDNTWPSYTGGKVVRWDLESSVLGVWRPDDEQAA